MKLKKNVLLNAVIEISSLRGLGHLQAYKYKVAKEFQLAITIDFLVL